MSLRDIFKKQGGIELLYRYWLGGALFTAVGQFVLLGKSRTALEILRLSAQFKIKKKLFLTYKDELKKLRLQKGWTQERLAEIMGVGKSTISMYENGNRTPDFETLEAIADLFNVDMNTLTGHHGSSAIDTVDPELQEYLDVLRTRPEMRMLFSTTKTATKSQIEAIVNFIEGLQGK